ncbi:uncharacterized protein LOC143201318 [Rhynchophorus ferrugineus]|uniref:uncharacterized protein LOC143201318 n=1 Tax=Rhynchophorus ferrugineus TaxID=354439 RepID=UPI003FCD451F
MLPVVFALNTLLCLPAVLAEIVRITKDIPGLNISDVVKVENSTFPGRLQITEELTIQFNVTEYGHANRTDACKNNKKQTKQDNGRTLNCCLMIYPPSCDGKSCTFQRKKVCWNLCSYEIEIMGKEQFSKMKYLKEVVPDNWRQGNFDENVTVSLYDEFKTSQVPITQQYAPYPYFYAYPPYVRRQYIAGLESDVRPVN